MITKFKNRNQSISPGFTLLETLIATGIAAIIITSALSVVATIYFSQKKVQFSHDFFAEGRFLMERISQIARNNTIDYDRYFVEIGPRGCAAFNARQVPLASLQNNNDANRATLGYANIFYWDTDPTPDNIQDRNLGGRNLNGNNVDGCTRAFDDNVNISRLFLINASRNMRVEIRHDTGTDLTVSMARQLGADTDGDGVVDTWGPLDNNGNGIIEANQDDIGLDWSLANGCRLEVNANGDNDFNDADERFSVQGNAVSEDWCDQGHLMQAISPFALEVEDLSFLPAPAFDPYLAFRNDEAQVQPNVFINLNLSLRNPDRYGFEVVETPTLNFQTTVSSRVFGNIRR